MQTFTIEEAARKLGAVARIAFSGEAVVLVSGEGQLELRPMSQSGGNIPLRPPGWFNDVYGEADADESNRLAARSPRGLLV